METDVAAAVKAAFRIASRRPLATDVVRTFVDVCERKQRNDDLSWKHYTRWGKQVGLVPNRCM